MLFAQKNKPARLRKNAEPNRFELSSLESRILWSSTPLLHRPFEVFPPFGKTPEFAVTQHPKVDAAAGLTATLQASNAIQLNWTGDGVAAGYLIMLSVDGGGYMGIAMTTGATTWLSPVLTPGHTYTFEVAAYGTNELAAPSNAAGITIGYPLPRTPTGLTATTEGNFINLTWGASQYATGYNIFRSTNGVNFTRVSQQTTDGGYTDHNLTPGQHYVYLVLAFNATGKSPVSAPVSFTAPSAPLANGVTITTRYGDELVITAAGADDSVSVTQNNTTLTITADGKTCTDPVPAAGLFIYTRGGTDSITLARSVTAQTTLETIDGAVTTISSAAASVNAWIDSNDIYTGTGVVHRVTAFAGGVSKATGASLLDPSDAGTTTAVNLSLFGTGPTFHDVNQGAVGDCYFLSSLAAFADVDPAVLVNSAVDMGDGTYVVQFMNGNTPTYIRVNNTFSTGGFGGFAFAHPGAKETIWAMVFEKAFCEFRTGANTYASISGGWMNEVYSDLGVGTLSFDAANESASAFYNLISNAMANDQAVTLATPSAPPNMVGDHCYTLLRCTIVNGVPMYTVRNPWGVSGDSLENGQGIAVLTFAQVAANFTEGGTVAVG